MKQIQTLEEAKQVLLTFSPEDMKGKYGLERIEALLRELGSPQEAFQSVHIAGTSGKTSTSYFIRGLLQAAGKRTGLTVSPHITAINERVQIDGQPLPEAAFLNYLNTFLPLVRATKLQPTYFELLIAFAYWVFAKEKIDYAVIEVGLGGLLDATNTIKRKDKLCVISDIGLDHTEVLGTNIKDIAMQKAGIIQPGNYVIVQNQSREALDVIATHSKAQHAAYQIVGDIEVPDILPAFQRRNFALALTAYQYLEKRDGLAPVSPLTLEKVAHETPPGRWEIYKIGNKTLILDGAHNPQKMEMLVDTYQKNFSAPAAVLANLINAPEEKLLNTLTVLRPVVSHLIIPEFYAGQDLKSHHSVKSSNTERLAKELGFQSTEQQLDIQNALNILINRPESTLLITGSLYLVSLVRPFIKALVPNSTISHNNT
jgi:dihydrofolate synthase/folylpolyglutamate synthase